MDFLGNDIYRLIAVCVIVLAALLGSRAAQQFEAAKGVTTRRANANALAGGSLLGAGLFHFLPEAHHHFEKLTPDHILPYPFAICAFGFAAILAVERVQFDPTAHAMEKGAGGTAPLVAVALSIHAFLTGIALGSEQGSIALISVALALGAHKFAASFTLGSSLIRARVPAATFRRVIAIFTCATPLGIVVGSGIQEVVSGHIGEFVEATFEALAAGTFLYIAALDVVHEEFFHKRASALDLLLFVGGLVAMLLLSLVS